MFKGFFPAQCAIAFALTASLMQPLMAADGVAPDISKLPPASTVEIDFARDVQPLLNKHCVDCHGPEKQKGGLRLDNKTSAFQGGDEGKVIVPDRSAESRLIHLIGGLEPDALMPPKGEPLTGEQIGLLRAWIDQGAQWPDDGKVVKLRSKHWSLQPLQPLELPAGTPNAIDAFITARLQKEGLALSAEADRATLIRRLSFDLTGLPPSPEEVDAFLNDASPKAYEALVDRLLASPHYGERWGRHWLDVARYTESQGFEYDKIRPNAWHYRDYVIKSFNEDKPYDRFMKEQVAGDVLEPVTRDGMIAPSLLVCGPWDEAGNAQANVTQKKITREDELEDLLGVVGQTFLGLTINCARCHAHKFDPIPHEDYYRLKSVFEGVKHGERPIVSADEVKTQETGKKLQDQLAAANARVSELDAIGIRLAKDQHKDLPKEVGPAPYASWQFDGEAVALMPGKFEGGAASEGGGLKLQGNGAYFQSAPLPKDIGEKTLEAWVSLATLEQGGGAAISIESQDGVVFDAIVYGERQPKKWVAGSNGFVRTQDLDIPVETSSPDLLVHMAIVYRSDNSIALYRNGEPIAKPYTPGSPLQTYAAGNAHVLLGLRHHGAGNGYLTGGIQRAALYDRALSDAEVATSFRAGGFSIPQAEILACLTAEQLAARESALAELQQARTALEALKKADSQVSYAGVRIQPNPTKRLVRGDVHSEAEVVTPGALSAVMDLESDFGLPADAPEAQRRLKFADWLSDGKNPLPARVMVNRIWHLHFGQGLVTTPNDFGGGGMAPTHPELLDWLAAKFIESGWSVKSLHRLILNSATYRQSSAFNKLAATRDADNQLLWRYSPRRLEAEAVRDAMLAVSGEINPQMGGPSFQGSSYLNPDPSGPEFNRRTVYRMNVNSAKDPLLDAFDCPDPSVKTPRRGITTTPLQALELMNNAFVQRQARGLAAKAMQAAGNDLPAAVRTVYRMAVGRAPNAEESRLAEAAARARDFTSVSWALLNSTEFVYVK